MKIAVVHSYYRSAQPSGENTSVDLQIRALRNAEHDVRLVAAYSDDLAGAGDRMRAAVRVSLGAGGRIDDRLREFGPDVIHLHNTFPNLGTSWLKEWGPRTVATLHNYRTLCAAGTMYRSAAPCSDCLHLPVVPAVRHRCYHESRVESLAVALGASPLGGLRRILRRAGVLVTLNEESAETFAQLSSRPVHCIPNFVEAAEPVDVKRRTGWTYVGRLTPEKGLDELLTNWGEDRLDIIGDGPQMSWLRERYGHMTNVSWLGAMKRDDLLPRLTDYRGLLIPSVCAEGLPTVALEALARGVPVGLSSHVSATSTLTKMGAAVPIPTDPGQAPALAKALSALAADPESRARRCRDVHAQLFSEQLWLERIEAVYESLLA